MSPFRLNARLASNSPADEEDVLSVKRILNDEGYFDEPSYGITPYPDRPLFEGIKRFQNDNGLEIDGVMNPGGETEHALRSLISGPDEAALPMPDRFSLSGRVGNGLENPPGDVLKSKQVLGALKYYPGHLTADPTDIIDRPLTKAIYEFQRDHGLQQDGWMKPGGETEGKIREVIKNADADAFAYSASDGPGGSSLYPELAQGKESAKMSKAPKPASDPHQSVTPIETLKIREEPNVSGQFGKYRRNRLGKHTGVDLEASEGTPVAAPVDGTIDLVGDPYGHLKDPRNPTKPHPLKGQFESVWIKTEDGRRFGFLYVTPDDLYGKRLVEKGQKVRAGDLIGTVQDRAAKDPGMINHTHFEVREGPGLGKAVDPAPRLKQWGVKER